MLTVEVWLDYHYGGMWAYSVMVEGKPYDHFISNKPLTHSDHIDVANGYREALDVDR